MMKALLSVAVGVFGVCAVVASAWALQVLTLPAPSAADQVLAKASVWLHKYRLVLDVFDARNEEVRGACFRRWPLGSTAVLSFGRRSVMRVNRSGPITLVAGSRVENPPPRLAATVGCSGLLEIAFVQAAQNGTSLRERRTNTAGVAAFELSAQVARHERLELYVSARTFRPLVASVQTHSVTVSSRLYLVRPRRSLLRRLRLIRVRGRY